ncbi:HEAT repeat domain-containing protein [Candidatus Uabimicrobium amorphum]|uniref:HEAT repeat-containing PBS lyase n=1 Tax=Uabimicrobium amorphum TaxID=2596890 RepID=A0A5S9F556_UABAM|nr:HEAT repeat domain-containing protein [Candidatus Uabimicrobium amorphum]BBM86258.1 HEAT repeat-containing PBS lyase [Candidatus Uabimicrobium amorphum]
MKKFTVMFFLISFVFIVAEDRSKESISNLVKQLHNADTRLEAIEKLGKMGPEVKSVLPALRKLLHQAIEEDNSLLTLTVIKAIKIIEPSFLKKNSQTQNKIDPLTTKSKRSLVSHSMKNIGGLNILGASHDFHQKLHYGKRHALVIGVNKYNKYYPELDGPNYDAGEVTSVLTSRYGFENVVYLCDTIPENVYRKSELKETPHKFAAYEKFYTTKHGNETIVVVPYITKKVIEKHLKRTFAAVSSNDAIFLFYAGHGVPGHIVATPQNKNDNGHVSLTKIAHDLSQKNAKHTLMVLDCCFGGSILQDKYKPQLEGYHNASFQFATGENIDRVFSRRSFQVISAGTGNEVVADKLNTSTKYAQITDTSGHSPFSAVFLQALKGLVGREDGIILTSDLGYYMMTNLTNDKRLNAKQTPRYGSLGGDGDFMFFPAYKVLNPKLLAPLYLSDKVYADFRSSGCEALGKFIDTFSEQDQISLTKSALHHIAKLLEDDESIPRKTALKFIQEKARKHMQKIKEFDDVVPALTRYFSYQKKQQKIINLESFFSLRNQERNEDDLHKVIDCLGTLHLYADEKTVDILHEYHKKLKLKWEKSVQGRAKPQIVLNKLHKLKKLQNRIGGTLKNQARTYHQTIQEYRWLTTLGIQELKFHENRMNLFLSNTNNPQRIKAFHLLKDELQDSHFKKYFTLRDQWIRKEVLEYLKEKKKDIEILFEVLKNGDYDTKKQIANDLEKIGARAFSAIVEKLKSNKEESKELLFAFLHWEKHLLFEFINQLDRQDQDFFIPIFAKENFDDLYETMTKVKSQTIRSHAVSMIKRLDAVEPFIAKFYLSVNERDEFEKTGAIKIISGKERKYSTALLLSQLLKSENKHARACAADALSKIEKPAISHIAFLLKNNNSKVRESAAYTLGRIGENAHTSVPALIPLLKDRDSDVRRSTVVALGRIGKKAYSAVPALIPLLKDRDSDTRRAVITTLASIGENAYASVPDLVLLLKDQSVADKSLVAETLCKIGKKAMPTVIPLLKNRNTRRYVVRELHYAKKEAHVIVPSLLPLLRDREIRNDVVSTLGKMGEKAHSAVPALIPLLNGKTRGVKRALSLIGKKAVPYLVPLLNDKNPEVRKSIIKILQWIGRKSSTALIPLLKNSSSKVKRHALDKLMKHDDIDSSIIPILISMLKDKDLGWGPYRALCKIGKKAIPYLVPLLKSQDESMIEHARWIISIAINKKAPGELSLTVLLHLLRDNNIFLKDQKKILQKIGEKDVSTLINLLKEQNLATRRSIIIEALGHLGEKADAAVPAITILLNDSDEIIRYSAIRALGEIGEKAFSAIPLLVARLQNSHSQEKEIIAKALGQIGGRAIDAVIPMLKSQNGEMVHCALKTLEEAREKAHKTVPSLIHLLKSPNASTRFLTVRALGRVGKKSDTAASALISLLEDPNSKMRNATVIALGNIGEKAHPAVPFLLTILKKSDKNLKESIVKTLCKIGQKAHSAVPVAVLIPLLKHEETYIRENVEKILRKRGERIVPTLIHVLEDKDTSMKIPVMALLSKIGEKAHVAVPLLTKLLEDQNPDIRYLASEALGKIGEKAHPAIPVFISILKDSESPDLENRKAAAKALGQTGEKSIPFLLPLLQGENDDVRYFAIHALDNMGKKGVSPLLSLLKNSQLYYDYANVERVILLLGKIGQEIVPALIPLLKHQNSDVRKSATEILSQIGKKAHMAVPHLVALLKDQNSDVRENVVEILSKTTEIHFASFIIPFLKDPIPDVRVLAASALGEIGEKAHLAVPALISMIKDPVIYDGSEEDDRFFAAEALAKIGKKAVPALIPLIQDLDREIRESAVSALGEMREKAEKAVLPLISMLENPNPKIKCSAIEALGAIGEKTHLVVPTLVSMLKDQDTDVVCSAASALGEIGEQAEQAVLPLISKLQDQDVKRSAISALGTIGKKVHLVVPILISMLKYEDSYNKSHIFGALREMAEKEESVMEKLAILLKDQDEGVRSEAKNALIKIGEKVIPTIRKFIQNEKEKTSIKLGRSVLNKCLLKAYFKEDQSTFSQIDLELLSRSQDTDILNTVAIIYAWLGDAKKARKYTIKTEETTAKRVKKLLEGKTPRQVEQEIKTSEQEKEHW